MTNRLRIMRRHGRLILAVAVSMIALGQARAADSDDKFGNLAFALSSPVFFDADRCKTADTDVALMIRLEAARQVLMGMTSLPADLDAIRADALRNLDACHTSMENLRGLDNYMPDIEGLAAKTVTAGPALMKKKDDLNDQDQKTLDDLGAKIVIEVGKGIINAIQAQAERDAYRKAYVAFRAGGVGAMAKACASHCKGSPQGDGASLKVALSASWNNTFTQDWLELRNDTGAELTNCTLVVKLSGYNAATGHAEGDTHLHFIKSWPAGTWLYAPYPAKSNSGLARDESADTVASVSVALFSDQRRDLMKYTYEGADYDRDVKARAADYLDGKFKGQWFDYSSNNHLFYNNGFKFWHTGELSYFPASYVTVTAKQGTRQVSLRWPMTDSKVSGTEWLSDARFNVIDNPDSVTLIFEFPHSSYTLEQVWNLRK